MDIGQRIAEILTDQTIVAYNQYGDDHISDLSAKMLADTLVIELGLEQEWARRWQGENSIEYGGPVDSRDKLPPLSSQVMAVTRWVTDWQFTD